MASISGAVSAIRGTIDIAKGAIAARDQIKLDAAEREMSKQMLDLLQTAFTLETEKQTALRRCAELEDENRKLKGFADDIAQYELHRTRRGGLCLIAKPDVHPPNMVVYLCANCANAGKKTYLQSKHGGVHLECPEGHPDILGDETPDYSVSSASRDFDPFGSP